MSEDVRGLITFRGGSKHQQHQAINGAWPLELLFPIIEYRYAAEYVSEVDANLEHINHVEVYVPTGIKPYPWERFYDFVGIRCYK